MSNFIVSFVGLQSLEKLYVIDSLVFDKLVNSKHYKSTTKFKLIEEYIIDDKNNEFKVYNIPEIYDRSDYNIFNNLKYKHIAKSNLIIWISSVNNAFQTTYEINEFNKLKKYIKYIEQSTGKIYYIIIMLSKYEYNIQLEDSNKNININDLILKINYIFPEEDIILYNVYEQSNNLIYYIFRKFIKKILGFTPECNTIFDISKYILDYSNKQQISYYNKFIYIYDKFINNESFDIMQFWKNITLKDQIEHITKIIKHSTYNNNYRVFQYINLVSNILQFNKDNHIVNYHMYKYYIDILKNNKFSCTENYYKNYVQNEVIDLFVDSFDKLPFNDQVSIYKWIIFNNNIEDNIIIKILNLIHEKGYTKEQFNFIQVFNNFIKINSTSNKHYHFYTRIKATITNNYTIEVPYGLSLLEQFNYYINKLTLLSNDMDYILLNKLEILNILRMDSNIKNFNKYRHLIIFNNHSKQFCYNNRLNNNLTYLNIINKIWTKIYSNVEIPYNHHNNDFIPFDKSELLYY